MHNKRLVEDINNLIDCSVIIITVSGVATITDYYKTKFLFRVENMALNKP